MDAVLALIVALAVFVPCAVFGLGKRRPAAPAETGERQETPNVTVVQKVTAVAVASIRQAIVSTPWPELGGGIPKPEGEQPPPAPGRPDESVGGWADPDLSDLDDLLDEDVRPPIWADAEREDRPPSRGLPALEEAAEDKQPTRRPAAEQEPLPAAPAAPAELPPTPAAADVAVISVDEDPVTLEGVDMSQAPIVPTSDGAAARLPSISQMQAALATGGFDRLMAWLRAFRKASNTTVVQAENLHADAMAIARRTRTKLALAMQAFQAVQADRLDRATIARVWAMLEQANREAVAAAAATRSTAALVVAAGGSQPTVAAAITTLQRHHGGIAREVQAAPQPVPTIGFYKRQ